MHYTRTCPKCSKIITSHSKRVIQEAIRHNRLCFECGHNTHLTDESKLVSIRNAHKKCYTKKRESAPYFRECPGCNEKMSYTTPYERNRADKQNRKCISCSAKDKKFSEAHRRNLSRANTGKSLSPERIQQLVLINTGRKHSVETKKRMGDSARGRKHSAEAKLKMRLSAISRIQQNSGQCFPRYNPDACKAIEEYGNVHGYTFQHAENGGEYHIKELGYWVDGYDEVQNVVIEVYEKEHLQQARSERDVGRQQEICEYLNCKFIVLYETSLGFVE